MNRLRTTPQEAARLVGHDQPKPRAYSADRAMPGWMPAATLADVERWAGVTDRAAFWRPFIEADRHADGLLELKRRVEERSAATGGSTCTTA